MLGYARRRPGAGAVRWIDGDARVLDPSAPADLVLCTGNAFMHIGTDELVETLDHLRRSLTPGGALAFETRNPAHREWKNWTPDQTTHVRPAAFGTFTEWLEVTSVCPGVVVFDSHNLFANGTDRIFTSALYFRTETELIEALGAAGFEHVEVMGTWEGDPVAARHRLLIVLATTGVTTTS
ncbi:MAG: class I SAM-dependent methyltransferase [Arthrobacter sp.]|nr:class I SAM-dependent methyltransferase [Micrococcaceae bacterium]MDN6330960.1 class I SAM-dependent methyltransferase [Micrococcaceae bacterium]